MKKVILAFSGGLDTMFSVPYLVEKGYEVITATVDTGGFSKKELDEIGAKSKKLGASKHYLVDGTQKLFESIASYIIKTHGLYQGSYPNMCADRYVIAEECIQIAKIENAKFIAHGSTAMGNDQVRFDVAIMTIAPNLNIIAPIRELGGDRNKEQIYLENKGFLVPSLHKKYSVNQNLLGVTYSGSEIDMVKEPKESMFLWTKETNNSPIYVHIKFIKGQPVSLNQQKLPGHEIIKKLNKLLGSFGYGRTYYTGDCIIGIKGHIAFEAPGLFGLIEAHKALEQLVLTKPQHELAVSVGNQLTDLMYIGKIYDPVVENLKVCIDSLQKHVTGNVTLRISPGSVQAVAVSSPFALLKSEIATYAQHSSWSPQDAQGFILLHGMQGKIASMVKKIQRGGD